MQFQISRCPKCGQLAEIIPSNNPLSPGICEKCIQNAADASNIKQADFFCRTYNLPFDPNDWLDLQSKCGQGTFKAYAQKFYSTNTENLMYQSRTKDWWSEVAEEWNSCITFEQLLDKIQPIRAKFIARNKLKWGGNYTFEEYVQLENLLVSTLRANDINNPLQIDAIKKACKISVALDKAIDEGDAKNIKELSTAYSSFTKSAQIDDIIAASNSDVISTVAELGEYIEQCGGEFHYYDNVDRDIVDKTIKDIKEYNRILVQDATGLGSMIESITTAYKQNIEKQAADNAAKEYSIQDILDEQVAGNAEFDAELETDTLDIDIGEDDDGNF